MVNVNNYDKNRYLWKIWKAGVYMVDNIKRTVKPLGKSAKQFIFSYFSTQTYVVGTQKNCLK